MNKPIFIFTALWFAVLVGTAPAYENADLPDAMTFLNGDPVKTIDDWEKRKTEIKQLWCDYFIGHYPDQVPALLSAEVVRSWNGANDSIRKRVVLTFDTPNCRLKATH